MQVVTLIRHAATEWNASGRFQGQSDVPLSAEGRRQAEALRRRLARRTRVDAVYSSPLQRALVTAQLALPGFEIQQDERLKELNFGLFESHTRAENEHSALWLPWYADPFGQRAPEGESYRELRDRVVAWFAELPPEGHTVAFSHSGTIQMLLSHVIGVEYPRWRKRFHLRHTSLTRLVGRGGEWIVERVNDTRHLPAEDGDPFDD